MKVQTNKTPAGFTPITTSITFETQEEFDTFYEFLKYDLTVPRAIRENTVQDFNGKLLTRMMQEIAEGIRSRN